MQDFAFQLGVITTCVDILFVRWLLLLGSLSVLSVLFFSTDIDSVSKVFPYIKPAPGQAVRSESGLCLSLMAVLPVLIS